MGPASATLLALAAVAAGLAGRILLDPLLGDRATFLFFIPAVVLAAALSGLWPGLLATVAGAAVGVGFDHAKGDMAADDLVAATLFLLVGGAVTVGGLPL